MAAESFTWFGKFGDVLDKVPEAEADRLIIAIARYGMYGEEPALEYPLDAIFESLREDIEHSKSARANGNKGGRPRKTSTETTKNQGLKPVVKTTGKNQWLKPNTVQNSTVQYSTEQNNKRVGGGFTPPTETEIKEYSRAKNLNVDAADFIAYYGAQGWKLSNGNKMKDWKLAAQRWSRRHEPDQAIKVRENYSKGVEIWES